MRVRDEYMVDARQLGEGQVADAAAGVDQNVRIEQEGRSAQVPSADSTGASKDA
jgi:hypothetical protein